MGETVAKAWECDVCHYTWIKVRGAAPLRCPGCRTRSWNRGGDMAGRAVLKPDPKKPPGLVAHAKVPVEADTDGVAVEEMPLHPRAVVNAAQPDPYRGMDPDVADTHRRIAMILSRQSRWNTGGGLPVVPEEFHADAHRKTGLDVAPADRSPSAQPQGEVLPPSADFRPEPQTAPKVSSLAELEQQVRAGKRCPYSERDRERGLYRLCVLAGPHDKSVSHKLDEVISYVGE